jgi:hypothetical protein
LDAKFWSKRLRERAPTEDSGGAGKIFELDPALFLAFTPEDQFGSASPFRADGNQNYAKSYKSKSESDTTPRYAEEHDASLPLHYDCYAPDPSRTATHVTRLLHKI